MLLDDHETPNARPRRIQDMHANNSTSAGDAGERRSTWRDQLKRRRTHTQRSCKRSRSQRHHQLLALGALASTLPGGQAQNCISLGHSSQCSAFSSSSISTDQTLVGLFPFLNNVTDTASFDSGIQNYIANGYSQTKYQQLLGCSAFDSSNTTDYYARYTTSVLCNAIIQNSISPCDLSGDATTPLCADSCADFATSEEAIADSSACGTLGPNALDQIRADLTNCALPARSLSGSCIEAVQNQPDDCGYATNLGGLCSYCATSSPNATDSCCVFSNTTTRCQGVVLPIAATSSMMPLTTTTATATPTSNATSSPVPPAAVRRTGISAGAIAGIVVGSLLGAFLLLALLILGCLLLRKKRQKESPASSIYNPSRAGPAVTPHDGAEASPRQMEALPGGRVARMAAVGASVAPESEQNSLLGKPSRFNNTPEANTPRSRQAVSTPPRRNGSLSGSSALALGGADETSPTGDTFSSPEGTGQSERLNYFKDYYSQDEIRPGELVATLWAYQPRAQDEFELERGDMIKVVGIWDDGWATGVRVTRRADDWRGRSQIQRDSGMNDGSDDSDYSSPEPDSEVKAFPLVCVCLPQHWRKTIEGEEEDEDNEDSYEL